MKYLVVCDYRENLKNHSDNTQELYNDHPAKKNIKEIIEGIQTLGYQCEYFGGIPELIHAIDCHETFDDCMFLNFTDGMDQNYSRVQAPALFDILNVPYSGSDVFPSVLMNNKHFCKLALQEYNIPVPKSSLVNPSIPLNLQELSSWEFPIFVKPNCEGSSLGISQRSVCHTAADVKSIVIELQKSFEEVLIEEYIQGIDVTNYLIGNQGKYYINDVVVAKLFNDSPYAVYDAEAKHNKLRTLYFNDEKINTQIVAYIQELSIKIANVIGAKDICRIDYRLNLDTQKLSFIEINSAPRFSSTSEIGFIAHKRGITFVDILQYYLQAFEDRIY